MSATRDANVQGVALGEGRRRRLLLLPVVVAAPVPPHSTPPEEMAIPKPRLLPVTAWSAPDDVGDVLRNAEDAWVGVGHRRTNREPFLGECLGTAFSAHVGAKNRSLWGAQREVPVVWVAVVVPIRTVVVIFRTVPRTYWKWKTRPKRGRRYRASWVSLPPDHPDWEPWEVD